MSKHQKLLDWIEGELISQNLRLGDQLPDDRKLARATGLSQNHVRESLKHCEEIGVVRLYEGKRKTILSELLREPAISAGPAIGLYVASSSSPQRDLLQTCLLLENYAVSAVPANEAAYAELERLLELMSAPETSLGDFHDLEADFHIQLGQLSRNTLISALLATMRDAMIEARLDLVTRVPLWSTTATRLRMEYRALIDAVKSGDPVLARALLKANLEERFAEADTGFALEDVDPENTGGRSSVVPVEVEDRELVPEEWCGPITPGLFDALQNIQPKDEPREEATPAPLESGPQEETTKAPDSAQPPTPQPSPLPAETPAADQVGERTGAPTVLRAVPTGSATRKRRGTVSSVVHATVLKPPVRTEESQPQTDVQEQLAAAEQAERVAQQRLEPTQEAELNRIERAQAVVKTRLAAAAQKRREARELAEAAAAERAAAEKLKAEEAAAEAERQAVENREAEDARLLEAKLQAEEERLAALAAAKTVAETGQSPVGEEADADPSVTKKRFGMRDYFGLRPQSEPQDAVADERQPETAEFVLPEGYESADSGPLAAPEYIDETAGEAEPADDPLEAGLEGEGQPRVSNPVKKKKKGKRKRR